MPSRKRSIKDAKRKAYLKTLDDAVLKAPGHVKRLLNKQPSHLAIALRKIGPHGYNGHRFDESGQAIEPANTGGANRERHEGAKAKAIALSKKYSRLWHGRGAAATIARTEGISADTVRRYKRQLRRKI